MQLWHVQCRIVNVCWLMMGLAFAGGCQLFVDDADREVYRLIDKRQQDAIGANSDVYLGREKLKNSGLAGLSGSNSAYDSVPHPIGSEVPASFRQATTKPSEAIPDAPSGDQEVSSSPTPSSAPAASASEPSSAPTTAPEVLSLSDALAYAFKHSREFQTAKETLYLAALDLSLERHLWTPQLRGEISSQYANYGQIRDFDHAMDAVAEVSAEQRLPFGGEVTARLLNSLMRDLTHHVTVGESGSMILEANIPLLRGAGRVARESLYQAERDLIYAVRTLERFRRVLAVNIAGDYFNLQQLRQAIVNAEKSILVYTETVNQAEALWKIGRLIPLEVQRAEQSRLVARNNLLDAIEAYRTALDQFKIRIGMPTETMIDVEYPEELTGESTIQDESEQETFESVDRMPRVSEQEAIRVALKYRLDLLNDLDRIGDSERGLNIAENNLLPDLSAFGSVRMDTDPDDVSLRRYNTERTTWRGGLQLELPLDRKAERNALRSALITKRQVERNYEEAKDLVRVQVRRAMRQVELAQESLQIQILNRDNALKRRDYAQFRFTTKGDISNREVVEAEDELLGARNRLTQAQTRLRVAVLEFWRDTGALRIDDQGKWMPSGEITGRGG